MLHLIQRTKPESTPKPVFKVWLLLLLLLPAIICSSCAQPVATPGLVDWNDVDPVFREYYRYLGGVDVLGPAISSASLEGTTLVQYVEAGALVFDAQAPPRERFRLAPLAENMGLVEPPIAPPSQPDPYYVEGHRIHPSFAPMYEQLGGLNVVGRPTTEMKHNPDRERYEQYFANLGFYCLEGSGNVHLLAYGDWACDKGCRNDHASENAIIDLYWQTDPTFVSFLNQLGSDFAGFPITEAYIGRDGRWEQVFENIILAADAPNDPGSVALRPLSKELGIPSDSPRPYSHSSDVFFYALEGNLGYEIPIVFWTHITQHGGLEIVGAPITHKSLYKNATVRQCFANLCLVYDPTVSENARVRPEPLGYSYRQLHFSAPDTNTAQQTTQPAGDGLIALRVWERFPVIASTQRQEIGIRVIRNNRPLAGISPILFVTLLDGSQRSMQLPATDQTGQTRGWIPAIPGLNGSLIVYQVCLPGVEYADLCVGDHYVIWNHTP